MKSSMVGMGNILKVKGGFAFKSKDFEENGCPIIRISNIDGEKVDIYETAKIPPEKIGKGEKYRLKTGDILMAMSGATTGKLGIVPDTNRNKIYLNQRVACFKLKISKIEKKYLWFFLKSDSCQNQIKTLAEGAAQPNISASELESIKIPLPPLPEQKRIAKILDAADALRAKRRESIAQLDELVQSVFLDMFGDPVANPKGWAVGKLSDVVDQLHGGKNILKSEHETNFRVLKVSAVTSGVYLPHESKFLPEDFDFPKSYLVNAGDLLISRANTTQLVGATAYVWKTPDNIVLPDKIWKFIWKPDAEIEPLFIYQLSKQPEFRRILGTRASGTSGSMKNISKPKLLSMQIPFPPLDLQTRFATIVSSIQQQKTRLKTHLSELDTLFAALQQHAFNGDL